MRPEGRWSIQRSPGSRTRNFRTCQGLRPRRVGRALAVARPAVLPSDKQTSSALGIRTVSRLEAGLCAPPPTLLPRPRGRCRTARGRCGLLLLHRSGLAPPTPCRSPGALARTRLPNTHLTHFLRLFPDVHHKGSLPLQLKVVWNLRLHADPEGPSLIFATQH